MVAYAKNRSRNLSLSSTVANGIWNRDKNSLRAIQNNALRCIWNMDRREGNTRLYEISKEQTLDTRLKNLQDTFICKALLSNNPIITKLRNEYGLHWWSKFDLQNGTM